METNSFVLPQADSLTLADLIRFYENKGIITRIEDGIVRDFCEEGVTQ